MSEDHISHITDRTLLRIEGEQAQTFLQNLVTCDMNEVKEQVLRYGCLLTPQGQVLHDFFVFADHSSGFYLDCDAAGADDLIRRLSVYKLRSKVKIEKAEGWTVFSASSSSEGGSAFPDPRLPGLGFRRYTQAGRLCEPSSAYEDKCISLGVPSSSAIQVGKDYAADLNLDLLNAVSFDKGCFVGQEVAARIKHRGLVKRRLLIIEGERLLPKDRVIQDNIDMGEVRAVTSDGKRGLAVLKLEILTRPEVPAFISQKSNVIIHSPLYMLNKD
jgi:folate-binding protein YgfZ